MAAKQVLDLENITLEEDDEDIGILLVGCTGSGKSATGNTILNKNAFTSRGGEVSVTREYHSDYTTINGRTVRVVDTPGFNDTEMSTSKQRQELVIDEITLALIHFPTGFHAVVPVISYNERLPEETNRTIRTIIELLDPEAFKSHGVAVVTGGDAFKRDYKNYDINTAFESWLYKLPPKLQWIREDCDGRCVLFNNVTANLEERERQRQNLMDFIGRLKNKQRYIPKICRWSAEEKGENFCSRIKIKKYLRTEEYLQSVSDIYRTAIDKKSTFDKSTIISLKESTKKIVAMIYAEKDDNEDVHAFATFTELLRLHDLNSLDAAKSLCKIIEKVQEHIYSRIKFTKFWYDLRSHVAAFFRKTKCGCDMM